MPGINDFRAQLAASRQKTVQFGGASITLRLPPAHAWRVAAEQHRDAHGEVMESVAYRALLAQSVVAWSGLPVTWIVPDAPADALLDYSEDAKRELLDLRQDVADLLTIELALFRKDVDARYEALAKN